VEKQESGKNVPDPFPPVLSLYWIEIIGQVVTPQLGSKAEWSNYS
jgi:hypothetical protein